MINESTKVALSMVLLTELLLVKVVQQVMKKEHLHQ